MKRFLSILAVSLLLSVCLFAEPKITEKQLDDFMENGTYIKIIWKDWKDWTDKVNIKYCLKQNISKVIIYSDSVIAIYDIGGEQSEYLVLKEYEVSFVNNNIIFTWIETESQ